MTNSEFVLGSYTKSIMAPVLFEHDIERPECSAYIIKNINNLMRVPVIQELDEDGNPSVVVTEPFRFYINLLSSNKESNGSDYDSCYKEIQSSVRHHCGCEINRVIDKETFRRYILRDPGKKTIEIDSDCILSRYFIRNLPTMMSDEHSYSVPVMHYKYDYKEVSYKWSHLFNSTPKTFKVRRFILSGAPFYQSHHMGGEVSFIPDWDERFYIDHSIFHKMNGELPMVCPTPMLHNWGKYQRVIVTNSDTTIGVANSKYAIHKFERVGGTE